MIEWLFRYLQPLVRQVIGHPLAVLTICLVSGGGGFWLASNLSIDNDLSKLIPQDYPSVQALNTLREQVGGEHEAVVAISSPSFEANKTFAEALIPRALQLEDKATAKPYFSRVEFRRNINFLKKNVLYFATDEELNQLQSYLEEQIEEARRKANPFYFELDDEEKSTASDSLGQELDQRYQELVGSEYTMSADSTVIAVKLFPTGSQTDIQFIRSAYADLDQLIAELNPSTFHPQMEVSAAGRLLRLLIEVDTITADVFDSFGAGVVMLLFAVVLYFYYKGYRARYGQQFKWHWALRQLGHTPAHAIIMALPLIVSLCWTFGAAWLLYGTLNIMTSTLGLLLFGMGIDFGIHFYARYAEERGSGLTVDQAIMTTFMTTGQAIFAVGLTTAAAFFILMLADFRGFSEFGGISGIGLLLAIFAYLIFLPALIVLLEKSPMLNLGTITHLIEEPRPVAPPSSTVRGPLPWKRISGGILVTALAVTIISVFNLGGLSFEYDFSKLEPTYTEFQRRNRLVWLTYSDRGTRNAAYIIVDRPEQAPLVADQLRARVAADTSSPTIRDVETFQERYPFTAATAAAKISRIAQISELLDDPFLKASEDANQQLAELREASSTLTPIPLDSVPVFLKAPFTSTDGRVGNLVIIHPSVGLGDGRNSMAFADDVGNVTLADGTTFYAGSTSIVASDMLRLMIREAPYMVTYTLVFIIIFKLIILRGVKWMVLALLPLAASFIWLFGLMEVFGWKLNFYNLVVLPTILGIGDDSGIHIVHRYLEEGTGSIKRVLLSTGEHIAISTVTTMLGFGGLLFSIHPGMRSIGEVAILGVGLSLFAALFVLPALLKWLEKSGLSIRRNRTEPINEVTPPPPF